MASRADVDLDRLISSLRYREASRLRTDVRLVLSRVGTLLPQVGTLVRNTGTESQLLSLVGTVAINYRGSRYNIPVQIYLTENYPTTPPIAYVRPTQTMDIKKGHRHVDNSGMVYMPYLHEWSPRHSNILGMCAAMSSIFGTDPPVYARPSAESVQEIRQQFTPTVAAVVPEEASKIKLTEKLQGDLNSLYTELRDEIDREFECQASLLSNADFLRQQNDSLTSQIADLQRLTIEVGSKAGEIDQALRDMEAEMLAPPTPADMVQPVDLLSRQCLNLTVENASIDDALYYLDKAISAGRVDLDTFLREVGRLARRQFECRALMDKIRGIQAHQKEASLTRQRYELQTKQHQEMQNYMQNQYRNQTARGVANGNSSGRK